MGQSEVAVEVELEEDREESVPMEVEVEEEEEEESAEMVEVPRVESVSVQSEPIDVFVYAGQLAQIKEIMGLQGGEEDENIKTLLVQHKGDLARVVPLLLR